MISKPLFKQSCKANAGTWVFVSAVTCAMLIITILVLGNLNVNEIRSSMTDMFVKDAIESTIEKNSMTYYDMTAAALESYESSYDKLNFLLNVALAEDRDVIIANYKTLIEEGGLDDQQARQNIQTEMELSDEEFAGINTLIDYYLAQGEDYSPSKISEYILNQIADAVYLQILEEEGQEVANTVKAFITAAINSFIASGATDTIEFATNYIPSVVSDVFHEQSFDYNDEKIYVSKYFAKEKISNISYNSIVSYRGELDIKEKQIRANNPDYSDEQVAQELESYKETIIADKSKTLFDELPGKVGQALSELGSMDVYELVIGAIFYRIAGLLLPLIFVIMTANNLIAGQVDSGSMAYILSTPTKRKKVTITQMCYLIFSLFSMFVLTTIASMISLASVKTADISITYGQMLLLNLGAFVTMLAISGICFLASCWFNRSKFSMSIGGGLSMFFLVATILGLFGSSVIPSAIRIDAMKYFDYVSILTLFDTISILSGTTAYLWKFVILIAIGAVTYFLGIKIFDKKDLPL